MGLGIAYVAANVSRLPVVLMDVSPEQTERGIQFMNKLLDKDVSKSKITAEHAKGTRELVSTTNKLSDLADVDYVIEAASENLDIKCAIFRDLDAQCKPSTMLATNTSSISITKIAAATKKADQVIGMHFMNPVPVMKLVEIIPGLQTDKRVLDTTLQLAQAMGKTTTVSQDIPGFVANRLLMPYINEAMMLLESVSYIMKIRTRIGINKPAKEEKKDNHPPWPLAYRQTEKHHFLSAMWVDEGSSKAYSFFPFSLFSAFVL
ncbi:3-hydroxyacyl-CoA dehydrogenase [Syncephalastrum racemosum]|uniref:3-hydroxyacyl-CoA dehydrogenase n=1 Tax=Syncephalastrum racemosum TaxID=13706 RepID=A0A1X2GZH2_SYNRA|nr:3-hydroxyacyl-CoA dehydrogenase [Syncephalastrum racemosum]